jgi:class 3 adenylate cyclase/tetratricopeptide (TPR) repeat protein
MTPGVRCLRCRHDNPADSAFCDECGAALEVACRTCSELNRAAARYCRKCGQPLVPEERRPQSYTPRHLADKIWLSRSALEGERKQVTVLFADMKGSMQLLADLDPEEARKVLDPVLNLMMDAVHRYEGTVNQVLGDGIMALFGAPLAHEDHAVRACFAALRMQDSVARLAEEAKRPSAAIPLSIRVGINSGEVVVRSIGSDLHMDYTAVGQTTHLAHRMEQMAAPGSVLITAGTLRLVEGYVVTKPLGPRPVKGLEAPVETYDVVGIGPVRSRLHAAAARGLTRFVGRDLELAQLHEALRRAGAHHGQVVAVVGEAGVGKSRLFWEFAHSQRARKWLILESRAVSYGKPIPYLPVIDLLRAYFHIDGRDDPNRIREKVTGKLLSLDAQMAPVLPPLLSLLDAPMDDVQWARLDPPERRRRTLDAVKNLLLQESRVHPLAVLLEDLHGIDSETQALLDGLVESIAGHPLLLLVNYRPGYQHGWAGKTFYTLLRIDPLPPDEAEELLRIVLGGGERLEPLKRLLIERTEGNPFFMEESVRALAESGILIGARGAYWLAGSIESIRVPPTVETILAARIDRLAPEDKALLQTAAVIGKDVSVPLLRAVAQLEDGGMRDSLSRLQAAEFLDEVGLGPDAEHTFRHALTHEVAYGSLLSERRCDLHARIVRAIEAQHPDSLTEHVERLAYHARRGELWTRAVEYLGQAGEKALARAAYREAVAWLEQALEALGREWGGPERRQMTIDVCFLLRSALTPLGEQERTFAYLEEARRLATELGDQRRRGLASAYLTDYYRVAGDQDRAIAEGRLSLDIARDQQDATLQIVARTYLAQTYHGTGEYRQAAGLLRQNVEYITGAQLHERFLLAQIPSVHSRTWLAACLAELGQFDEGLRRGEEAVRIGQSADHPVSLTGAYVGLGTVHLRKGDLGQATQVLERALEISGPGQLRIWLPWILSSLGLAHSLLNRRERGLPLLEQAVAVAASMKRSGGHSIRLAALGEGYLLAGRLQEATRLAEQALGLARNHRERANEAYALRLLGEAFSRHGAGMAGRAEDFYRQAIDLSQVLGMRPLTGLCRLGLGRLLQGRHDVAAAREHLRAARVVFAETGMDFWLAQATALDPST